MRIVPLAVAILFCSKVKALEVYVCDYDYNNELKCELISEKEPPSSDEDSYKLSVYDFTDREE